MRTYPALTHRFDRALLYATHIHGGQTRKGTAVPYIAHLLAVAATVLEYGGSQDVAIAALLHDAVEDQGGEPRLANIYNLFGDRVADIVRSCLDSVVNSSAGPPLAEFRRDLRKPEVARLRVCPKTLGRIAEFSEHEAD
jgi:(p)ppGpp synthase/HD superfamily hydrolase